MTNINDRLFIDLGYIYYQKPFLKSTNSYIRMLKKFPNAFENTLHWARNKFECILWQGQKNAYLYIADSSLIDRITKLPDNIILEVL